MAIENLDSTEDRTRKSETRWSPRSSVESDHLLVRRSSVESPFGATQALKEGLLSDALLRVGAIDDELDLNVDIDDEEEEQARIASETLHDETVCFTGHKQGKKDAVCPGGWRRNSLGEISIPANAKKLPKVKEGSNKIGACNHLKSTRDGATMKAKPVSIGMDLPAKKKKKC